MNGSVAKLLAERPTVIAIGAAHFAEALRRQGADVVQVEWRPPPNDERVRRALDQLL